MCPDVASFVVDREDTPEALSLGWKEAVSKAALSKKKIACQYKEETRAWIAPLS